MGGLLGVILGGIRIGNALNGKVRLRNLCLRLILGDEVALGEPDAGITGENQTVGVVLGTIGGCGNEVPGQQALVIPLMHHGQVCTIAVVLIAVLNHAVNLIHIHCAGTAHCRFRCACGAIAGNQVGHLCHAGEQQCIGAAVVFLEGQEGILPVVIGFGHVEIQRIQPVLPDLCAAGGLKIV